MANAFPPVQLDNSGFAMQAIGTMRIFFSAD
jgi:hypothetical protein